MRENLFVNVGARLASVPFRLFGRREFVAPSKILLLKPCCISQVMMATPLLTALDGAYPEAQIDWAVSAWARPAIVGNVRVSELIDTGRVGFPDQSWADMRALAERIAEEKYDTCFVPSRSARLAWVAWQAGIPQRIGLDARGRGFAHTMAVPIPAGGDNPPHESLVYLALAQALGIEADVQMEFYPSDGDRARVTTRLVDEVDWLGDVPLVILHVGGGSNPTRPGAYKQWPVERFVLLGNYVQRQYGARVLLVGSEDDQAKSRDIKGMMAGNIVDLTGKLTLGELGALCEVADLYVGTDTGPTHISAALGCPTLALFGAGNPAVSGPYATKGPVTALWHDGEVGENSITVDEAMVAADQLLAK